MKTVELFLLLVLPVEGISGQQPDFYHKVGDDVVLPCIDPPSDSCSTVGWLYNDIVGSDTQTRVVGGKVTQRSDNAARLSVGRNCSLIIKDVVPEDAGRYTCRLGKESGQDRLVHLVILSISLSQPDDKATTEGNVKLQCSLWRFLRSSCTGNTLIWVNDTGSQLDSKHVTTQQQSGKLDQCVSTLTLKNPSTRYTCQFLEGTNKIEVHFSPGTTGLTQMNCVYIIGAVVAVAALLLVAVAAVLFKRRRNKESEDQKNIYSDVKDPNPQIHQNVPQDANSGLTYASLSHLNPKVPPKVSQREDVVTYSAIRPNVEMEVDVDPNSLYSGVSK